MKFLFLLFPILTFGQINTPNTPQPTQFQRYDNQNFNPTNRASIPNSNNSFYNSDLQKQQIQHQQIINEVENQERKRLEIINQIRKDINEHYSKNPFSDYNLPSLSNVAGTKYYYDVFDKMLKLDSLNFSVKEINFDIENAYFENKLSKDEFNQTIKKTG